MPPCGYCLVQQKRESARCRHGRRSLKYHLPTLATWYHHHHHLRPWASKTCAWASAFLNFNQPVPAIRYPIANLEVPSTACVTTQGNTADYCHCTAAAVPARCGPPACTISHRSTSVLSLSSLCAAPDAKIKYFQNVNNYHSI